MEGSPFFLSVLFVVLSRRGLTAAKACLSLSLFVSFLGSVGVCARGAPDRSRGCCARGAVPVYSSPEGSAFDLRRLTGPALLFPGVWPSRRR